MGLLAKDIAMTHSCFYVWQRILKFSIRNVSCVSSYASLQAEFIAGLALFLMLIFCPSSSSTIVYYISIRYANSSLTWVFNQSFSVLWLQPVPPGLPNIDNSAHGIEKLLLNTQISEDFTCEINIIYYFKYLSLTSSRFVRYFSDSFPTAFGEFCCCFVSL